MEFCPVVANLCLRIVVNVGRLISIFINMALTAQRVLIVFTLSNFEFTKLNCCDVIARNEWSSIHPISVHWIITMGDNAGVLSQAATI